MGISKWRLNRREVLAGLGAGTLLACKGDGDDDPSAPAKGFDVRSPAPDAPWEGVGTPDDDAFDLGVQCGDPLPSGVLLWTHLTVSGAVSLHLARWDDGWTEPDVIDVDVEDGFVRAEVDGLEPDASYAYQFTVGKAASRVGSFRTAPPEDSTMPVRIGATSCTKSTHGEFVSIPNLLDRFETDLWIWNGDIIYAYTSTLAGYRGYWAEHLVMDSVRAANSANACLYIWDDHEVTNNWDAEWIDSARLETARDAMFENTAKRRHPDHPQRMWQRFRHGRTVEIFVLDCRGERFPSKEQYISKEQMDWLKDGLQSSDAVWKLVVNTIPITNMPPAWDVQDSHLDRWEGFPTQRQELLDHITDNALSGVLFLTGDFHQCGLQRVEPESHILELFSGPGGPTTLNVAAWLIEDGEQFLWADADYSATWLELLADGTARIAQVDELGQTLFDGIITVDGELLDHTIFHPWEQR